MLSRSLTLKTKILSGIAGSSLTSAAKNRKVFTMDQTIGSATKAERVIPLMQALNRVEDNVSAIALRLDPIVNHAPSTQTDAPKSNTVTGRLQTLGDALQYLLDNLEL